MKGAPAQSKQFLLHTFCNLIMERRQFRQDSEALWRPLMLYCSRGERKSVPIKVIMERNEKAAFNVNTKMIPTIKDDIRKAPSANSIIMQNGKNTISFIDGTEITSMVSLTVSHLQDLGKLRL